jgi:ATP-dependent helicase HrpB
MQNLPVTEALPGLKKALSDHTKAVLQAPPGAGKTTVVPIALMDEAWLDGQMIILLEPRRLAARNAASRMADLLGETVGERVGYQIRNERRYGKNTRILVVTEGILTRKLQSDPTLEGVGLVIFDEFHERNLHADLGLALALQSQELLREDLKLLVMSATLNTQAVSDLLDNAPIIQSEGRSYPVAISYLDPKAPQPDRRTLVSTAAGLVEKLLIGESGSILVFLPGAGEITNLEKRLIEIIKEKKIPDTLVAPLFGSMDKKAQDAAITAHPGKRKVVIATNIAETSLTIEGISLVVDSGLQRTVSFHPGTGMDRMETRFISKDSATQRSGRAGRLGPGKSFRLWHENKILQPHQTPEILQADLTPLMLEIAAWGAEVDDLHWMDRPPESATTHATELLQELGALDHAGAITPHGREVLKLGLHPRLAHMLLKAKTMALGYEASLVAALLEEKDIFTDASRLSSDLVFRLQILHDGEWKRPGIDAWRCRLIMEEARRFRDKSGIGEVSPRLDTHSIGPLLAFAYPDRIAKCRGKRDPRYLLSGGKGAVLNREDAQMGEPYLVAADLEGSGTDARIYLAAPVSEEQLKTHSADLIRHETVTHWNTESKRVEARERTTLGSLTLEEKSAPIPSGETAALALIEGLKDEGLDALPWTKESRALQQRVNFLGHHKAAYPTLLEHLDLPDLRDETLLKTMGVWLLPYLNEISNLEGCKKLDMKGILLGLIPWETQQRLDELAPSHITVPSGSRIAVDYSDPKSPVLAVRLQELFGQKETPAVLKGAFPLLIHLLSPAHRPMQVTKDLTSFWQNGYDEVKKELRGKYKKHYWPDDPLTAQATNKTKKFM